MAQSTSSWSSPSVPPIAGQYTRPQQQIFKPSPPQQYAHAMPIPFTQGGDTSQPVFAKINKALTPGPLAKIIIKIQQARF